MKALSYLIDKYPIDQRQIEGHLRAGFAARRGHCLRNKNKRLVEPMLVPPPSNESTEMRRFRETLPTFKLREEILRAIRTHKVTLITGGTGCGKTTQVPQFILEEASAEGRSLRIICTQPRRLPAIAVADRVAKERNERLGSTVGYHIRLEQKTSSQTALTYCTSGVLLRMLTIDDVAHSISHIFLDEIHEREQNTDYLLIALKQALKARDNLKVILMSATMEGNLDTFMRYFVDVDVAHVDIPSRLHHVEKFFLSEVLALTGYKPPHSLFGGTFSSTGLGQSHVQTSKNFDSFPQVDEFRCDTVGEDGSNQSDHTSRFATSSELISVRTAPNLGALTSNRMTHHAMISNGIMPFERRFPPSAGNLAAACTGSLVTSASTSALQSHGLSSAPATYDEYEKLAQTLADTKWNEINYSEMQCLPNDDSHMFAMSSSKCAQNTMNNSSSSVPGTTTHAGAGTDSMEEGPDVVELPDSDEELARIQTADAVAARPAYTAEIEPRLNYTPQRLFGWNNPYNAPPFYSSQFAYQQQPYQIAPSQHLALTCSQARPYEMRAQRPTSVMLGVQATATSQQKKDQATVHFGTTHPPRFFVSHESFDGSLQSAHQQSQNCSAQPVVAGLDFCLSRYFLNEL
uniref:Helicase ATP-binding domain-containing protein n=1 Tax=Parascaris univalens TaxID=6257 RepID=A0A915AZQ8_PARUN